MTDSQGKTNPLLYVAFAVGVLGLLGGCCVTAIAIALVYTRAEASEDFAEDDAYEPVLAPDYAPSRAVDLSPPATLALRPMPSADRRTRHVEATVTDAQGMIGVSNGDRCSFDVQVLDQSGPPGYYCRAFVECAGVRLFGDDVPNRTGYFPCEIYDGPLGVAGEDLATSIEGNGGDPAFQIDTRASRFVALDDATGMRGAQYRITARVDSVTAR